MINLPSSKKAAEMRPFRKRKINQVHGIGGSAETWLEDEIDEVSSKKQ